MHNSYSLVMRQLLNKCLLFPGLVIFLSAFTSCKQEQEQGQDTQQRKVDAVIVNPSSLSVMVTSTGDLLPNEQVEIKAPVSGNVMSIHFEEGTFVRKGENLITIDDRSWKAQLEGLKAAHASAVSELNRKEALLDIEGASTEEVEQARATVKNLQAQINELNIMIDLASVKAPFSGQVGMRDFSLGAYLQQGTSITTLAQTNPIKVDFTIAAKYASKISVGQQVKITSPTNNDTTIATVYAIDPVINLSNRSLQIRALLANKEHQLIPGDFIRV
ncbi:MAG: efflux RND transporter periplasmic adaptor subunit, partial [Bacteroidota bacterium]